VFNLTNRPLLDSQAIFREGGASASPDKRHRTVGVPQVAMHPEPPNRSKRRGFLSAAIASAVACVFAKRADAAPDTGDALKRHERRGDPPVQPLDTMVLFERGDQSTVRGMTHLVLSLIHEEKGENSYPWTLYTSLDTHHTGGDACVICSRLHKHGPGWSTGVHSEVYAHNRAVAVGMNIEMSNDYAGSEEQKVIGLNIQAVDGPTPMQYGIHIHDKSAATHFETGIGLNGRGKTGVDLGGQFGVGLNARGNSIRVNEGTAIELEGEGRIKLRYQNGRIEFLNGEKVVGHLDVNGEDHAM
jgi:hypothetical protein